MKMFATKNIFVRAFTAIAIVHSISLFIIPIDVKYNKYFAEEWAMGELKIN